MRLLNISLNCVQKHLRSTISVICCNYLWQDTTLWKDSCVWSEE